MSGRIRPAFLSLGVPKRLSTSVFLRTLPEEIIMQTRTRASAKHKVLAAERFCPGQDRILQGV